MKTKSFLLFVLSIAFLFAVHPKSANAQQINTSSNISQLDSSSTNISNSDSFSNTQSAVVLTANQQAVDSLSTPTLLPDSPFYFLKRWGENIQTFFTIDDYQRAQLQLRFAQERLAEANVELKKGRTDLTDKMLTDYNETLEKVNKATQKLTEEGKEVTSLIDTIKDHEDKRLAILENRLSKTTDPDDKKRIENQIKFVKNQSQTNINRLVNALTEKTNKTSPYQTFTGQVTAISGTTFTLQIGSRSLTFNTDSNTEFKLYDSKGNASFADLKVGIYVRVTVMKSEISPTPGTSTLLAKRVIISIPVSLIKPLVGTIANFSQNSFTLNSDSGVLTINIDNNTRWRINGKEDAKPSDIKVGIRVRVYAKPTSSTNVYLATLITVELKEKSIQKQVRNGIITAIGTNTITVHADNGKDYTISLNDKTVVNKGRGPGTSANLVIGARLRVVFILPEGSTIGIASLIEVKNNNKLNQVIPTKIFPSLKSTSVVTP